LQPMRTEGVIIQKESAFDCGIRSFIKIVAKEQYFFIKAKTTQNVKGYEKKYDYHKRT